MKKEERQRLLKKLGDSSQGKALEEVIDILVDELKDNALNAKDMHEVKGSKYAIDKLNSLKKKIDIKSETHSPTDYE